eukprot:3137076-Alexandrium_andersonii.AAC.1
MRPRSGIRSDTEGRQKLYLHLFGVLRRQSDEGPMCANVYFMPEVWVRRGGRPPPESAQGVASTGALECVKA